MIHQKPKSNMLNTHRFILWFIRNFNVISKQKAEAIGLRYSRGVYGDEINHRNCRSIYVDNKQRIYRIKEI